ncbi:unnamed protein product [Diabrotica balteata]|uniref:7tm 6 domain containing protein n=1 Tax=Diabrotica balteata TaxID=107213 RepID=A0A9N9SVQ5_DIABA|nr:unnamed protein product [Diabrotica balteata]
MMSIGLYAGCTMTCSFWGVYPYTDENGPFLPIAAYIPINTTDSTTFGFVYAYEIIATLIGGYTDLSSDCLIASLIMVVCGQLNILNDSLVNITKMANQELKEMRCCNFRHMHKKQELVNQKLKECVDHHKAILEFGRPPSDTCNVYEEKINPGLDEIAKKVSAAELMVRKRLAKGFYSLVANSKELSKQNANILGLVFDFIQNVDIPKVPVQEICYLP